MTGFGRGELSDSTTTVTVELSSVNRKQGEVQLSLPKAYASLEPQLRKSILSHISRGRIHGAISVRNENTNTTGETLDLSKAEAYESQFQKLSKHLGRPVELTASDFLKIPDLFQPAKIDFESATQLIVEATENALQNLLTMRLQEGVALKEDCIMRLERLRNIRNEVEKRAPESTQHYKTQLLQKLHALDNTNFNIEDLLKDERVLKEIALYADRSDITEELTRLSAHLTRFDEYIASQTPVGRQLDFLCQELHRELNTIQSKAQNASIAHLVVSGKTEVEKIREQVQNIE